MKSEKQGFSDGEEYVGEIVPKRQFEKTKSASAQNNREILTAGETLDSLFEKTIELLKEKNGATLDETTYQDFDNAFLSLYYKLSAVEEEASVAVKNRIKNERPTCNVQTPRGLIQYGLFLSPFTNQVHFSRQPLRD